LGVVVAALLVGQQQTGVLGAGAGGLEAVLRVEQDGAGVRGENADHRFLEFAHHVGVHFFFVHAFFFGDEVAQRAALVHGRRGDHALGVGHRFHSFDLARADLHGIASHSQGAETRRFYHGAGSWTRIGTEERNLVRTRRGTLVTLAGLLLSCSSNGKEKDEPRFRRAARRRHIGRALRHPFCCGGEKGATRAEPTGYIRLPACSRKSFTIAAKRGDSSFSPFPRK